mgnify:CR=1 FL=1
MRFGPLDLNLSVFDGTARDPDILPCLRRGSGFPGTADGPNCDLIMGTTLPEAPLANRLLDLFQRLGLVDDDFALFDRVLANIVLVPEYARLRQMGLEAQYIRGALALKLEAVARERGGRHRSADADRGEPPLRPALARRPHCPALRARAHRALSRFSEGREHGAAEPAAVLLSAAPAGILRRSSRNLGA